MAVATPTVAAGPLAFAPLAAATVYVAPLLAARPAAIAGLAHASAIVLLIEDRFAAPRRLFAPDRLRTLLMIGALPQLPLLLDTLPVLGDALCPGGFLTLLPGPFLLQPVATDAWLRLPVTVGRLTHLRLSMPQFLFNALLFLLAALVPRLDIHASILVNSGP